MTSRKLKAAKKSQNLLRKHNTELLQWVVLGRTHFGFYKLHLLGKVPEHPNFHPAYQEMTMFSHADSALLNLTKVCDPKSPSGLRHLLSKTKEYVYQIKGLDRLEREDLGSGFKELFTQRKEVLNLLEIDAASEMTIRDRYKAVWAERDWSVAHYDHRHLKSPEKVACETAFSYDEFDALGNELHEILLRNCKMLHVGTPLENSHVIEISDPKSQLASDSLRMWGTWAPEWELPKEPEHTGLVPES